MNKGFLKNIGICTIFALSMSLVGCEGSGYSDLDEAESDLKRALESKNYDFDVIKVVNVAINKMVKLPNKKVWPDYDIYRVNFDYTVEFQSPRSKIQEQAQSSGNESVKRALRSVGSPFEEGERRSVKDVELLLVLFANRNLPLVYKIDGYDTDHKYLDFDRAIRTDEDREALSKLSKIAKETQY